MMHSSKQLVEYVEEGTPVTEPLVLKDCPPYVRKGFVRRVYTILTLQFATTCAVAIPCAVVPKVTEWMVTDGKELYYVSLAMSLLVLLPLSCYKAASPHNTILLCGFTLCVSVLVSYVCALYASAGLGVVVAGAFGATSVVFACLTAFVWTSGADFRFLEPFLMVSLLVLLATSVVGAFVHAEALRVAMAGGGVLLFSGFVLHDTSELMLRLGPDDAIEGAVQLYIDVINLFLYMLETLLCVVTGTTDR